MVTRKLKPEKFNILKENLEENTRYNQNDKCYSLTIRIDKNDYVLKIQLTDVNRIVLWNALEVNNNEDESNYSMITNEKVLTAMLDFILWQRTEMYISN